jgi:hypothetical protein
MPKKAPSPKPSSSGSISESDVRVQFSISLLESEKAKKEDKTPKKSINLRETISIPIIKKANLVSRQNAIKFEDQKSIHSDPFQMAESHDPEASKILKILTKNNIDELRKPLEDFGPV